MLTKTTLATHSGNATVHFYDHPVVLRKILLVPNLQKKIISVGKLAKDGWEARFNETGCKILKQEELMTITIPGILKKNIYLLEAQSMIELGAVSAEELHKRLAHPGKDVMAKMGLPVLQEKCHTCVKAEHPAKNVNRRDRPVIKTSKPLEIVHLNLIGPFPESLGGNTGALIAIDNYMVICLSSKGKK